MSDLPPPGWYTDPEDPAQHRYWDGSQWTDHQSPGRSAGSGHRGISGLLTGTGRLFAANWRPFVVIYTLAAVVAFGGEQLVRVGFDTVFGDTLTAPLDEIQTPDPESEDTGPVHEDPWYEVLQTLGPDSVNAGPAPDGRRDSVLERWSHVWDRVGSLSPSTLGGGVLLMAIGGLAAGVVTIVQFAALGHLVMRLLAHQPATVAPALLAGLRRVLRIVGVGLMLLVMLTAAWMVASFVTSVATVASGLPGAVFGIPSALAAAAAIVGAMPVALVTLMTAAVGPSEPSMLYARSLLRGSYGATLGRTVLLLALFAIAATVVVLVAALAGLLAAPLETVTLYVLSVLPETLILIALFILYHDLGGEHADATRSVSSPTD